MICNWQMVTKEEGKRPEATSGLLTGGPGPMVDRDHGQPRAGGAGRKEGWYRSSRLWDGIRWRGNLEAVFAHLTLA